MMFIRQRMRLALWRALPLLTLIAALLAERTAAQLFWLKGAFPPLVLPVIYYWSVHEPKRCPYALLFALGMANDFLSHGLFLSALLWMGVRRAGAVMQEALKAGGFVFTWGYFALVTIGCIAAEWLMSRMLLGPVALPPQRLSHLALLALLYPSLHVLIGRMRKALYRRVWFALKAA